MRIVLLGKAEFLGQKLAKNILQKGYLNNATNIAQKIVKLLAFDQFQADLAKDERFEFINEDATDPSMLGNLILPHNDVIIRDQKVSATSELGLSIKPPPSKASALLSAERTTNFIFKIEKATFTDEEIEEINLIDTNSKVRDRIEKIILKSGRLKFIQTENMIFGNNLVLIYSVLPKILANITYKYFTSPLSRVEDLVKQIALENPIGYNSDTDHPFYVYKIKRFLTDIALGMMPSKVWKGELDATGGYLVVKDDGDVLCYHIYNRNVFEDYLLSNTKLDTASSTRHGFGIIYRENGELFFKLNLQIRFIK